MISLTEATSYFQQFSVLPLIATVALDSQTPVTVLYKFLSEPNLVLLEGISEHVKNDRYSYLGLDPYIRIEVQDVHDIHVIGPHTTLVKQDFYVFLKNLLSRFSISPDMPSFCAGLMGKMNYECFGFLEPQVSFAKKKTLKTSLASFILPRTVLIFDHHLHTVSICRHMFREEMCDNLPLSQLYKDNIQVLESLKKTLMDPPPCIPLLENNISHQEKIQAHFNIETSSFIEKVKKAKAYIESGDIFQIQISRRASLPIEVNPLMIYRYLRSYNPSPFLFYLKLSEQYLIGASPEILVNVDQGIMCVRPLAGTRKRYSSEKSEEAIIDELLSHEKEKAEHIMLVDLGRNDVGRCCEPGSVKVTELMSIEKYTHVIHMVSEVQGRLKAGLDACDALKFGFPAGTVTGTPKVRAMEIISELEEEQREFYAGGVVFFDFSGNLKSAISIRSIFIHEGMAYTQAAAGIVQDSIPEMELKETENKMRSALSALAQFLRR